MPCGTHRSAFERQLSPSTLGSYPRKLQREMNKEGRLTNAEIPYPNPHETELQRRMGGSCRPPKDVDWGRSSLRLRGPWSSQNMWQMTNAWLVPRSDTISLCLQKGCLGSDIVRKGSGPSNRLFLPRQQVFQSTREYRFTQATGSACSVSKGFYKTWQPRYPSQYHWHFLLLII